MPYLPPKIKSKQIIAFRICLNLFIAIFIISCFHRPVAAEASGEKQEGASNIASSEVSANQSTDLEQITRSILHKQIELEKLNTHFRIETTLVGPWRQRRMFVYGESNASLTESGLITRLPVNFNLARKKIAKPPVDQKNRSRLVSATRQQLIGQLIGAGGDVFELGLNFVHYCSIKNRGFNPTGYRKQVRVLQGELDRLIDKRRSILDHSVNLSPNEIHLARAEEKLLDELRDLSLLEYAQYLSATKRFWAFQNTAFLVDFAKNATGAAGNIVGLEANHRRRLHMVGSAFLLSTISGAIVMVTPMVGRVTGNLSGLAAARTASRELTHIQTTNAEIYLSDKDQFLRTLKDQTADTPYLSGLYKRKALYEKQEEIFLSAQQFLKRQRERARGTLTENIVFAALVGPPRIANGVLGMIGSWHYYNNSPDRNRLFAAGTTAYLAGTTFNMFETARVQAFIELQNRELAKTNLLPRQQFNHRLDLLENMDQILTK